MCLACGLSCILCQLILRMILRCGGFGEAWPSYCYLLLWITLALLYLRRLLIAFIIMQFTLQFQSIIDFIDFQTTADFMLSHYNLTDLTITGTCSEADIELAKAGFGAVVIEVTTN